MNTHNLPKQALQEFRELYLSKYGIKLDDQQTEAEAMNFLELLKLTLARGKESRYNSDRRTPRT